jgi:hypothetical protein
MKQTIWMMVTAGFLIGGTALVAKEHRSDRAKNPERAKNVGAANADVFLASREVPEIGPSYEGPPPAPGIAVPPAPMAPVGELIPGPGPAAVGGPPLALAPAPMLYPCVKYRDRHRIAPGAVPMCVAVRDPCAGKDRCGCNGPPKCVLVEICVPPCGCPKITCRHDGTRVRYDYGKYAVNITSRHGVVVVNYDG